MIGNSLYKFELLNCIILFILPTLVRCGLVSHNASSRLDQLPAGPAGTSSLTLSISHIQSVSVLFSPLASQVFFLRLRLDTVIQYILLFSDPYVKITLFKGVAQQGEYKTVTIKKVRGP